MQYEIETTEFFDVDASVSLKDMVMPAEISDALRSKMGVSRIYEMQAKVMDFILRKSKVRGLGDVILCAPTGSGKTLAYALPIVENILKKNLRVLWAIVVVPTRDLALQVYGVFKTLTEDLDVNVSIISGAASVSSETESVFNCQILIATPGRLVDHIDRHPALDLNFVRYLVLDESDRLLEGPFQSWIDVIVPLLGRPRRLPRDRNDNEEEWRPNYGLLAFAINPHIVTLNSTSTGVRSEECVRKILVSATQTKNPTRVVKLGLRNAVFFAPGSSKKGQKDEEKAEYTLPSTLKEKGWVVRHIQDKPMALLKLLGWSQTIVSNDDGRNENYSLPTAGTKLIFTNSVESAHRLCRLLEVYAHISGLRDDVLEMSGELSSERRKRVVDAIRGDGGLAHTGKQFLIVVCSDVLARGMDMLNVDAVINYDAPAHISTYVHRVGRTARAGRPGVAVTLLLSKQVHHFREMTREADRRDRKVRVKNMSLLAEDRSKVFDTLSHTLILLKRIVRREKLGLLSTDEALPSHVLHEMYLHMQEVSTGAMESKLEEGQGGDQVGTYLEQAANGDDRGNMKRKFVEEENIGIFHDEEGGPEGNGEQLAAEDELRDLLYAQIARNFLSNDS